MARFPPMPGRRLVYVMWGLLGLVLAISLAPAVVGSFLGDDYVGEVEVEIAREPGVVWEHVLDHASYPVNSSAVLRVVELDGEDGLPAWEEEMSENSATVRTVEREPGRRVVRELRSLDGLMRARWVLELEPSEEGTRASVRQEVHIDATGLIGAHLRFVMRFMNSAEVGPSLYLARLEQELEAESDAR